MYLRHSKLFYIHLRVFKSYFYIRPHTVSWREWSSDVNGVGWAGETGGQVPHARGHTHTQRRKAIVQTVDGRLMRRLKRSFCHHL